MNPETYPLPRVRDRPIIQAVEVLRVAAVTGVIWFHLENAPFPAIGHAGLVAFVMICTIFQSISASRDQFLPYLRRRTARLAPPWLAWSAIYAAANLLRGRELFPWSDGWAANLLTGPWIGLWFLPFVWLASPVVFFLTRWTSPAPPDASIPLLLCLAGLLLITAAWLPLLQPVPTPWGQWLHAAPAIPLSIALRHSTSPTARNGKFRPSVVIAVWLGICIPILWIHPDTATSHSIGAVAAAAACSFSLPLPGFLYRPGSLCLGVYLIHPIIIAAYKIIPILKSQPLLMLAATVPTCFWLVHQLRRYPAIRPFL